ncbi:MAG: EamA family transporter [Alphaproteobacteria bacterium]|nr:EamA family transporter [Alphaproteobacteria bacterium]OJV17247.1 MAG: hypothetical protein BGO27_06190 [Alphaproteobacteria bacterium 33-17]
MLLKDIGLIILATFLTGLSYIVVKFGLVYFPPLVLIGIRFLIVGLILMPLFLRLKTDWFKMLWVGLIMCLGFQTLIVAAIASGLDVATSIICQQMSVPFTSLMGVLIYNEKIGVRRSIGLACAFLGMVIVVGSPTVSEGNVIGILLALASAFFYAFNNILLKKMTNISPLAILYATSIASSPVQLLLSYQIEDISLDFILNAPLSAWLSILYMSILTSIVAYSIWIKMLQKYSVHQVMPFGVLVPIFGILCSPLAGDSLNINTLLGSLVAITGIAIININKQTLVKFLGRK